MKSIPLLFFCSLSALIRLSAQIEVLSNGNVGIGTTSPQQKLHLSSNGQTVLQIEGDADATGDASYTGITLRWGGAERWNIGPAGTGGNGLVFRRGGSSNDFIISNSGNVGIGTTTPTYKLEIVDAPSGYGVNAAQLMIKGGHGGGTAHAGIRFSMYEHSTGWGSDIQGFDDTGYYGGALVFRTGGGSATATPSERMRITTGGNIGIGTTNPGYKLEVAGSVRATSFISNSTTYADFVFDPGYRLTPLSEVEAHIRAKRHLPGIPSESEAKEHGIDLADMQVKLLQKIEELTLHQIAQEKRIQALEDENRQLKAAR